MREYLKRIDLTVPGWDRKPTHTPTSFVMVPDTGRVLRKRVRIEVLEHGRSSSYYSTKGNERMKLKKIGQILCLLMVQI